LQADVSPGSPVASFTTAAQVTPVPEPSNLLLMASGLDVMVQVLRWRRMRQDRATAG
jgi:hypothetical protein